MPGSHVTHLAPKLSAERRAALIIATSTYNDASLRQLRAPSRDAADLSKVLSDVAIGGFTVTKVIDRSAQEVRLAIQDFLTGRSLDDLVLVYVSCHGLLDARRRLYFAAKDTRKDRLAATAVEAQWMLEQLEECRSRRQVVILDCCFSGAFDGRGKGGDELDLARFHGPGRGRAVLTASRSTEYSFEGEPQPGAVMPGSVFTRALVEGIRTGVADVDHDGYISVDDAYIYAFERIRNDEAATQTPQRWLYGAEGKLLLARSPAGITTIPAPLPEHWRQSLEDPHPAIRLGAIAALSEWLTDGHPARALAARQTLKQVADNDIPRVAEVAARLLHTQNSSVDRSLDGPVETVSGAEPVRRQRSTIHELARVLVTAGRDGAGVAKPVINQQPLPVRNGSPAKSPHRWWRLLPPRTRCSRTFIALSLSLVVTAAVITADDAHLPLAGHNDGPLTGHNDGIESLAFSPDGKTIASSSYDGTILFWGTSTRKPTRLIKDHSSSSLAFSRDGKSIASAHYEGVTLLDPSTGKVIREIVGHKDFINSLAFSPDGAKLASAGDEDDKTVRIWNPVTGKLIYTLTGHKNAVQAVAFSPDGKTVASVGGKIELDSSDDGDTTVRLWNMESGKLIKEIPGHKSTVLSVSFSPNGKILASAGYGRRVILWDPSTGERIGTLTPKGGNGVAIQDVEFSPDGDTIAAGTVEGVWMWDADTYKMRTLSKYHDDVNAVAFSPDSKIMACGSGDFSYFDGESSGRGDVKVRLWNPSDGRAIS